MNSSPTAAPLRLLSLDVYRGAVMLLLAFNGLGLAALAADTDSALLDWIGFHNTHPDWISQGWVIGLSAWDMIQPSFMFIVGVAVPYSFAKRQALGDSRMAILRHGLLRALLLTLLGVFLSSTRGPETNWLFTNVLSQIGLGYGFLLLLAGRSYRSQILAAAGLLLVSWLIFALYPVGDPTAFAPAAKSASGTLQGFFGHWSIHSNAAAAFDRWFLNLFPRTEPFISQAGGYQTLNFLPAAATMILGLLCGQVLRDETFSPGEKLRRFVIGGATCLLLGVLLGATVCPVIKRLWTPSWVLYSGAYAVWLLAFFYWVVDVRGWKGWTFPFVIVGMNPLAMYLMGQTLRGWVTGQLHIHLPDFLFTKPGGHVVDAALAGFVLWLVCLWLYRKKVFIRL